MAFCSTNNMPLRAASLLTASLCAPPLAEDTKAGIRGCSCRHGSLFMGRRAKRHRAHNCFTGPSVTSMTMQKTDALPGACARGRRR